MELTISTNGTGVSPAVNYSVTSRVSGNEPRTRVVKKPVVKLNLQENTVYNISASVKNIYGDSGPSVGVLLTLPECEGTFCFL